MDLLKASDLRKLGDYKQALYLYEALWRGNPDQFSDWDGWSYAYCLSKELRHEEALELCRILYSRYKSSAHINFLYAKSIYYTQFAASPTTSLDVLRKALDGMFKLSPPHSPYSFTPMAVFRYIKIILSQQNIYWEEIEKYLNRLEPDLLNDNAFQLTNIQGKSKEYASQKEQWYANMIRVKAGLNQPQELLRYLEIARKNGIHWHYNNDIWFARKEAFALAQLGEKRKAEKILREITKSKKDWFLLYDLSQIVEDREEALKLMCSAALAFGKNEYKIKLFYSLYQFLQQSEGYKTEAGLHLCLWAAIREENDWEVDDKQSDAIRKSGLDRNKLGSSSAIIKKLIPFWEEKSGINDGRLSGKVSVIHSHQKTGFINDGIKKYFFKTGKLEGRLREGMEVTFGLMDSFDKKRNMPSKMAVNIRIVSK